MRLQGALPLHIIAEATQSGTRLAEGSDRRNRADDIWLCDCRETSFSRLLYEEASRPTATVAQMLEVYDDFAQSPSDEDGNFQLCIHSR